MVKGGRLLVRTVLFGAGQYGITLYELLDRRRYEVIGFLDNTLADREIMGAKVYHPDVLPELGADCVMLALMGEDRRGQAAEQLAAFGVPVVLPPLDYIDLRGGQTVRLAGQIARDEVPGAVAELGVYQGEFAALLSGLFPERKLLLFDTFTGFSAEDIDPLADGGHPTEGEFGDTSAAAVVARLPHPENAVIVDGHFPESAVGVYETFCFVSLDVDLYRPTYEGLRWFYPRMQAGGYILVHDAQSARFPGAGEALRQFCKEEKLSHIPLCDHHGSALLVKSHF